MLFDLYYLFNKYKKLFISLFFILIFLGWIYRYNAVYPKPNTNDLFYLVANQSKNFEISGVINEEPKTTDSKITFIILTEKGKTLVNLYSPELKLFYGDKIKVVGKLDIPPDAPNPDEFSYKKYLERKNIFTIITAKNITVLEKESIKDFKFYIIKTKNKLLSVFYQNMPKESADFVSSLVFGAKSVPVSKEIQNDFTNVGLSHVLAASGMQVSLIMATGLFIITFLKINQILGVFLTLLTLLFYMALTDFPPSILRAGFLNIIILLVSLKKEKIDTLKTLFLIVLLLIIYDPLLIHDIGFQFSILATFALLYAVKILEKKLTLVPYFFSNVIAIIISAQLFVLPLQIYYFSEISIMFLPANLIATVFVDLLTILAIITTIINLAIPFLGVILGKILYFIISIFIYIVEKLADFPYNLINIAKPSIYLVICSYALLFFIIEFIKYKEENLTINEDKNTTIISKPYRIALLVLFSSFSLYSYEKIANWNKLKVVFINVGQGDATLIQTPKGKNILIDCGQSYEREVNGKKIEFDAAKRYILPFFKRQGIKELDKLIITHPDSDHIGGCNNIINSLEVKEVWDSGQKDDSKIYTSLLENILKKNIPLKIVNKNETFNEEKLSLSVINEIKPEITEEKSYNNNNSILLKLIYDKISFLFCADIEKETEFNLLEKKVDLKSTILKVPHHGSKTSSTEDFLEKVKPELAIISVGKNNVYKHPANEVLERLNKINTKILRTDLDGGIIIETNGDSFVINKSVPTLARIISE
ncbi:MAG: DNA internalization-related competence protein ComEC/Rec2 [Candidatus Sericytochromatia bacterium]